MLLAVVIDQLSVSKGGSSSRLPMATDDKITSSIICEHTRQVASHDNAKPVADRKREQRDLSTEIRRKEFNRSRRMLLANALRLRRTVKALPDDTSV